MTALLPVTKLVRTGNHVFPHFDISPLSLFYMAHKPVYIRDTLFYRSPRFGLPRLRSFQPACPVLLDNILLTLIHHSDNI